MIKHILITLGVLIMFYPPTASKAFAPDTELKDKPLTEIVQHFAEEYDYPSNVLLKVMECESGGVQSVKGDGGLSHGVFQIQKETWSRFTKQMGEELNITSPMDQAKVAAWAFKNGHGDEWTTYVAIRKGGTYTFWYKQEQRYYTVHCKL